jgi:hypothetical protein
MQKFLDAAYNAGVAASAPSFAQFVKASHAQNADRKF